MINVTKTFLPPQSEYTAILKKAWDAGWITNRGTLVKELEAELKAFLNVPNIIAMTNGTLPLQIAIKALGLTGEIITTPFSYVATTSSIVWEGCTPVFVDIDPEYLTIDESKIEAAITPRTTGILATHVFGNPCDVETIEKIAQKHNLKVIYDAAHCFGVTYKGKSIFEYGDVSTCSFHATKLFHTGEGGAVFCKQELYDTLYYHHNFGHAGPDVFNGLGINAKMSELQAAMGLAVLKHIDFIINARKRTFNIYLDSLKNNKKLKMLQVRKNTTLNYSYFPIISPTESINIKIKDALEQEGIMARRYFYPSLNTLEYVKGKRCPIAESFAKRILCLPLSHDLPEADQKRIIAVVNKVLND
ncbi:DegT/DnrJ/EryC1/StrS family aminotransferase [Aequorivita antarctica]|uniref:DegT/DnrJ/EryC1/StrS family aminotransferase n=1 Tax=Aequorivita antarctica TaxID=153266 RepID=A0A5C6YZH6_9FLAO|nr:DegT/DnrJ/EryC1/StrS family aminotransferase [Aequorivita antarctica]TXD72509.1 DegT/DnrJ/EryC1/StrS family aminotransferase [Aequorivita antarctica]SRX75397.1 dTDP-4-amino-4,6-dideoxy-D-glucose transaminase [Aequorivita antarctica]